MREKKDITGFHVGLINNPDHKDIPDEAASDSSNLDPDGEGVLKGVSIAGDAITNSTATGPKSMTIGKFIKTIGGNYDLILTNGTSLYTLGDFYGTPALVTMNLSDNSQATSEAMTPTTMVIKNEEVHIGQGTSSVPKWVGRTNYNLFGASTYSGDMCIENAECPAPGNSGGDFFVRSATEHAGTSAFDPTLQYRYTVSYVLDGLQETPLSLYTVAETITADADYITVIVECNLGVSSPESVNRRVTGIKVYRREEAQSPTGTGKLDGIYKPVSSYRLIKEIDTTASTGWATDSNDKIYTFNDANDFVGSTYEDNTGIAETLTSSIVNYTISAEMNNYLFVGHCAKTGLPDAGHMIFRSKPYRYDMFDWTNDYLKLPTIPTALAGYRGRLYAFDLNNMYVINPENFSVEDTLEGMGCTSHKSWVSTDFGLFWASKNNIYWHDGNKITPIGERIKTVWQTAAASATPILTFYTKKSLVMIHLGNHAYSWHVYKKRFDYYATLTSGFTGAVVGKDGEEYNANGTDIRETFGGATARAWYWTSKEFDMDDSNQLKKWYYLHTDGTGSLTLLYNRSGGTPATSFTNDDEFKLSNVWEKVKTMKIKISGAAGNKGANTCESAQIVFRRLRGIR